MVLSVMGMDVERERDCRRELGFPVRRDLSRQREKANELVKVISFVL